MSAINGLSVVVPKHGDKSGWDENDKGAEVDVDKSIVQRSQISLANIFFKVSDRI